MTEQQRHNLVIEGSYRLGNGSKCEVGGWKNSVYATVTCHLPGFFSISWGALKRAKENNEPIYPDARVGPKRLRG